jgi:hypothetical protein
MTPPLQGRECVGAQRRLGLRHGRATTSDTSNRVKEWPATRPSPGRELPAAMQQASSFVQIMGSGL